jgi:quinol monooxygenase YgiN
MSITRIVKFGVKAEYISAFGQATIQHAEKSSAEAGVTRFEVLQNQALPEQFYLIISFIDEDAREKHFNADHYKNWQTNVKPMFDNPPDGVTCIVPLEA